MKAYKENIKKNAIITSRTKTKVGSNLKNIIIDAQAETWNLTNS